MIPAMHGQHMDMYFDPMMGKVLNDAGAHHHHAHSQHYHGSPMLLDNMVLGSPNGPMLPMESDIHMGVPDMQYDIHMTMGDRAISSSTGNDPKKKKGVGVVGKSIEEELCRICGDRASGYHYNALSCEGCKGEQIKAAALVTKKKVAVHKGFFRRSITRGATYHCKYGGNCEMDMWMRRKCQACRLRRCREVGMKEECLLSEEQCKARDVRRKQKSKTPIKKGDCSPEPLTPFSDNIEDNKANVKVSAVFDSSVIIEQEPLTKVSEHTKTLVEKLVYLQDRYEFPDEQVIKSISVTKYGQVLNDPRKDTQTDDSKDMVEGNDLLTQLAQMTVVITHLIVEFAKNLPGFVRISKEDQIVLLKAACSEVMAIRAARCYDLSTKTIVLASGTPCTMENMIAAGGSIEYWKLVFQFCHALAENQTDNTEYALFTAICIFSERQGLQNKDQVEQIQKIYLDALMEYEDKKRLQSGTCLAKLLIRLSDLRSISVEHSKMLTMMQMDDSLMPGIVQDIYIQER